MIEAESEIRQAQSHLKEQQGSVVQRGDMMGASRFCKNIGCGLMGRWGDGEMVIYL